MRIFTSVPATFWMIVIYLVVMGLFVLTTDVATDVPPTTAPATETETASGAALKTVGTNLEEAFDIPRFELPLFDATLPITITTIFMALGFVSQWIEAIRATQIRRTGGNDLLSVLIAFAALLAFAGLPYFQTTAFLVVVIVGFGDVLLDRVIGQAVARRDFGPLGLGGGAD